MQGQISRIAAKSWTCARARATILTKLLLEGNPCEFSILLYYYIAILLYYYITAVWFAWPRAAHELKLAASHGQLHSSEKYTNHARDVKIVQ